MKMKMSHMQDHFVENLKRGKKRCLRGSREEFYARNLSDAFQISLQFIGSDRSTEKTTVIVTIWETTLTEELEVSHDQLFEALETRIGGKNVKNDGSHNESNEEAGHRANSKAGIENAMTIWRAGICRPRW